MSHGLQRNMTGHEGQMASYIWRPLSNANMLSPKFPPSSMKKNTSNITIVIVFAENEVIRDKKVWLLWEKCPHDKVYYQNTTVKIFVGEKLLYWLCGKISKVEWGFSTCFTENILNKTKPKIDTVMGRNSMPESTVWCIHTIHKHNFANN